MSAEVVHPARSSTSAVVGQDGVSALPHRVVRAEHGLQRLAGHLADVRVRVVHRLRVGRALRRGGATTRSAASRARRITAVAAHRRLLLPHHVGASSAPAVWREAAALPAGRPRHPGLRPGRHYLGEPWRLDSWRSSSSPACWRRCWRSTTRPAATCSRSGGRAAPAPARASSTRAATPRTSPRATQSVRERRGRPGLRRAGLDPYLDLGASMVGSEHAGHRAAAGGRRRRDHRVLLATATTGEWWRTTVAPLVGAVGLIVADDPADAALHDLTQTDAVWVKLLPLLLVVVARRRLVLRAVAAAQPPAGLRRPRRVRPAQLGRADGQPRRLHRTATASSAAARPAWSWPARSSPRASPSTCSSGTTRSAASGTRATRAHRCMTRRTSSPRSTPRASTAIPMPADYPDYPRHDQILDYIRGFASTFGIDEHATLGVGRRAGGAGRGRLGGRALRRGSAAATAGVVCANGVTWHPYVPEIAGLERFTGEVRHSVTYRSADGVRRASACSIVGAGNSGVDIACDAARSAVGSLPVAAPRLPVRAQAPVRRPDRPVHQPRRDARRHGVVVPDDPTRAGRRPGRRPDEVRPAGAGPQAAREPPDHEHRRCCTTSRTATSPPRATSARCASARSSSPTAARRRSTSSCSRPATTTRSPTSTRTCSTGPTAAPTSGCSVVHPTLDGLYVLGFVELADAAYRRFDEMAQLVAHRRRTRARTGEGLDELQGLRRDRPPRSSAAA